VKQLDKIWVGLVEENNDPDRLGRIKVRVQSIFDDMPVEDIPWSIPMKSLGGCSFEVPAIGKIVTVIFPNDNLYEPCYMYSDHYNYNLQKKLSDLDDDLYTDFFALAFDHRTKIYSDDNELTMDYKYNKITVDNDNINLELKDNSRKVNIGCKTAEQQAVLGNHWFDWMDKFVQELLKPSSLIDSQGSPVLKTALELLLIEYQQIRETFVSDHVYIVDDNKVKKLEMKYNAPYLDDSVKINDDSVGTGGDEINFNQPAKDLKDKIKDQKDKSVEELKDAIPSDAKIEGETADDPYGFSEDYDTYKEIKNSDEFDITKERYDEIKNKELQESGLDAYEIYDDPQDADDIIANMSFEQQIDTEASETDLIQADYVFETNSKEKYVDKTDISKKSEATGKIVSCSDINETNFSYNLGISKYFTIGDLTTGTTAGKHPLKGSKTVNGVTYSKYDIACNLKFLCVNVIDKIKDKYPDLSVNSAYRNNGGKSQHELGQAADLSFKSHSKKNYLSIAQWIQSNVNYDQLLFEFRDPTSVWIHVSYNPNGNRSTSASYPKYATFLNDKTYKRLQLTNVSGWNFA